MGSLPPWPVVQELLLRLVLPAFAAAAALFGIVCLLTRSAGVRMIAGAAGLAAGLFTGNYCRELLTWWPLDPSALAAVQDDASKVSWWQVERGWTALLPAAAVALCGGLIAALISVRTHKGVGVALRVMVAAVCALWLTEPFSQLSLPATIALVFAGMVLNWESAVLLDRIGTGRIAVPVLTLIWGGAAATVLIFAHSARFSDLAVSVTSAFFGAGIVAVLWGQNMSVLFSAPAIFLPGLLLGGAVNTFSEVPLTAFALTAFAPCALWVVFLPPIRRWPLRFQAAAAVIAVLVPCAAAVTLAMRAETLDFGDSGSSGDDAGTVEPAPAESSEK
jgi:hypothetical protein